MHNLTRFSAKECYFKAGLLYLANDDTVGADNASLKYCLKDPSYETSRENKLIKDLLVAIRAEDVGSFENLLFTFNKITPLDRWKIKVLSKAKTYVSRESEEDFS
jgi:alpha-soluble NSF attachment protein